MTPKGAARLRGLVARHARCEWNMAATAHDNKDRALIVQDADAARKAVYAEIMKLTGPKS